jgi:hypothetical protein
MPGDALLVGDTEDDDFFPGQLEEIHNAENL